MVEVRVELAGHDDGVTRVLEVQGFLDVALFEFVISKMEPRR